MERRLQLSAADIDVLHMWLVVVLWLFINSTVEALVPRLCMRCIAAAFWAMQYGPGMPRTQAFCPQQGTELADK